LGKDAPDLQKDEPPPQRGTPRGGGWVWKLGQVQQANSKADRKSNERAPHRKKKKTPSKSTYWEVKESQKRNAPFSKEKYASTQKKGSCGSSTAATTAKGKETPDLVPFPRGLRKKGPRENSAVGVRKENADSRQKRKLL